MRLRNNIFAAAFDYLKREKGIRTQKRLAEMMGVSEDTITRILKDRCEVTEDIITKLQTASGCIFNLQWLRGEDDKMLASDVVIEKPQENQSISVDVLVSSMRETIEEQRGRIADLQKTIALLEQQLANERTRSASISGIVREKNAFELGVAEPLETPQPDR